MKRSLVALALILLASVALATPPNTPTLDGRPIEYDGGDLRGTFEGDSDWGSDGTLTNLYVTWDATYLYVALQAWQANNNKLVVLLDVDPDADIPTGATTTVNWTGNAEGYLAWNGYGWIDGSGTFGLDYMIASEGFYNNVIRVLYDGEEEPDSENTESLFDQGNGTNPVGSPVDMASLNDASPCLQKGFEARIPWSVLYEGGRWGEVLPGETVPRDATIRILAGIHNNNAASTFSSPDTIPNQTGGDYDAGILTAIDYIDIVVDSMGDGIPDMLAGDFNAPYLRSGSAAVGSSTVFLGFNEPVTLASVENTANWSINGVAPVSAAASGVQGAQLTLAAPIASADMIHVRADGVEDLALNTRVTDFCLYPASDGIALPVNVTFVVNTNSGMGISASHTRPTGFFVNGGALPLEWGYPPYENMPLAPIPGSNGWASATVTFPAGSPSELFYKYSGRINGTNNYEAIRLTDYADAARPLTLNDDGTPITVVDYLGAAAHPLRSPGDTNVPTAHRRLFEDVRRGDAGVRHNREILFQLDLSMRNTNNISRVMVLGSDPLRGFNWAGILDNPAYNDYPGSVYLTWAAGGIELVDDGTLGDEVAGDGIYSRLWAFSTNGLDSVKEPGTPHSLVGGAASVWFPEEIPGTQPFEGHTRWTSRRSPRSLIYKYYVFTTGNNHYDSPGYNLDYYVVDPDDTAQIVLAPWIWDNDAIPPRPPENAPIPLGVTLAGTTATVQFDNLATEAAHGVLISTNLRDGFDNYGHRAVMGDLIGDRREWSATIAQATGPTEFYAPYAGLEPDPTPIYWEPNVNIPTEETTVRIYFNQFQSNLRGMRTMNLTGNFKDPEWDEGQPMTFTGDGTWMTDVVLPATNSGSGVAFKPRGGPTFAWLDGGDYQFVRGSGGVTMDPLPPVPGEPFTITLDAAGTPLAAAADIYLHMGFDGWQNVQDPRPAMTNISGTVWEYTFDLSEDYSVSVDWVFTTTATGFSGSWYSNGDWHAFMAPYFNAP